MSDVSTRPDRKYTKDHEWAKPASGNVTVGITEFAVEQLGDITLVSFDVKVGDVVTSGKTFGTIESVKTLSDLYAPVSGKVIQINEDLEDQPELVNSDPWDKGYLIVVEPIAPSEYEKLMDAAAYQKHAAEADH